MKPDGSNNNAVVHRPDRYRAQRLQQRHRNSFETMFFEICEPAHQRTTGTSNMLPTSRRLPRLMMFGTRRLYRAVALTSAKEVAMQVQDRSAIPTAAAVEGGTFNRIGAIARSLVTTAWMPIAQLLRGWWRRELQRRELSILSPRDFGDLAVPQSLVTEEIRQWPWQKSSQQWGQVTDQRGNAYDGSDRPRRR